MSTTRRVLLGITAAGLVSVASGCAAVGGLIVGDLIGGGDVMASGYEMVPGREYSAGPQMVARLSVFGGSDGDDCGLSAKQVWQPDPTVAIPNALSGPGVGLAGLGLGPSVPGVGVPGLGVGVLGLGVDVAVRGIGLRASPLTSLTQPLAAARQAGGHMSWWLDYDSCPAYPETPR